MSRPKGVSAEEVEIWRVKKRAAEKKRLATSPMGIAKRKRDRNLSHRVRNRLRAAWTGKMCAYCRVARAESTDHFIPHHDNKAERQNPRNFVASCVRCNSEKGDVTYEDFLARRAEQDCAYRFGHS